MNPPAADIAPILTWPHPALEEEATEVPSGTPETSLRALGELLVTTMRYHGGIGLAAPQMGVMLRVVVVTDDAGTPRILVNPEIRNYVGETEVREEACLSFPGVTVGIPRCPEVIVRYRTVESEDLIEETWDGRLAHVAAHEIDHLDGVTLASWWGPVKRDIYRRKLKKASRKAAR